MDDEKIIELYNARSESAIAETDSKYGSICRCISFNILSNREDAEECVNDAYLNVWDAIPPHYPRSLSAFLSKIVRNLSLNRLKMRSSQKRGNGEYDVALSEIETVLADAQCVDEQIDEIFLREKLNLFLETLPKQTRAVFIGRYWYFDSIKEISKKTGFSVSKTKMILLRTRNDLKKFLENESVFI